MDTVRLGVLGCGNMARAHLRSVGGKFDAISPDLCEWARAYRSVAHGRDLARAEGHQKEFGGEYAHR